MLVCVCNFSPVAAARLPRRPAARGRLARGAQHGRRRPTAARASSTAAPIAAEETAWHGQQWSAELAAAAARRRLARAGGLIEAAGRIDSPAWSVWPGRPFPLGATWDGDGTNFSVFSENAERVELCLFDAAGDEQRYELTQRTAFNWHGYLARRRARASATASACTARTRPSTATASTPRSCCSIPYAKVIDGGVRWDAANAHPYVPGEATTPCPT